MTVMPSNLKMLTRALDELDQHQSLELILALAAKFGWTLDAIQERLLDRLGSDVRRAELPELAPERYADRTDRTEKPVAFINRVYAPWLGQGLTRAHLAQLDPKLYMALHNWLRANHLPADLDLPTRSEIVSRGLEVAGRSPALDTAARLQAARIMRRRRLAERSDLDRRG